MSILQQSAIALADFLMTDPLGAEPYRGVIFVIGLAGHVRAGHPPDEAKMLYKSSLKFARAVNAMARKGLTYDPLDIVEFNSFDELIAKHPRAGHWQHILLITHASGEQPAAFTGSIFFGDKELFVNDSGGDLLDEMNRKRPAVEAFQKGFAVSAPLRIIACGVGATGPAVANYLRELFGVEGKVKYPNVNVDFTASGKLGTPVSEGSRQLRDLEDKDTASIPAKADQLAPAEPIDLP